MIYLAALWYDVVNFCLTLVINTLHHSLFKTQLGPAMSFTQVTLEGCHARFTIVDSDMSSVAQTWLDSHPEPLLRHRPLLLQFLSAGQSLAISLHLCPCCGTEFDVFLGRDALSFYREACGHAQFTAQRDAVNLLFSPDVSLPSSVPQSIPSVVLGRNSPLWLKYVYLFHF